MMNLIFSNTATALQAKSVPKFKIPFKEFINLKKYNYALNMPKW